MSTYTLTCTPHTATAQQWAETITGTLESITNRLVEINEVNERGADLFADYWPYVYWQSPDTFTLDDGETAPPRPDYTPDAVIAIASSVFDESEKHITLTANE